MRPPDSDIPAATITLPVDELTLLADVLAELDRFLRSPTHHDLVFAALRAHAAQRGGADAGYLIDAVQFNAAHLRRLIAMTDAAAIAEAADGDE
jgi:hypothetical protein